MPYINQIPICDRSGGKDFEYLICLAILVRLIDRQLIMLFLPSRKSILLTMVAFG